MRNGLNILKRNRETPSLLEISGKVTFYDQDALSMAEVEPGLQSGIGGKP